MGRDTLRKQITEEIEKLYHRAWDHGFESQSPLRLGLITHPVVEKILWYVDIERNERDET